MDSTIDYVLQNILTTHVDVFGKKCSYIAFETVGEMVEWSGFRSKGSSVRILYRRENETGVQSSNQLFLKKKPDVIFGSEYFFNLPFINEIFFYSKILPFSVTVDADVRYLFPKCYSSLMQYNCNSEDAVIVFDNLKANGYHESSMRSFLDYDHLSLMMRKLGEFHAFSYRAREQNPKDLYSMTFCSLQTDFLVLKLYDGLADMLRRGVERVLNNRDYKMKYQKVLDMVDRCDEILHALHTGGKMSNPTHVLCHGDFCSSNIFFKYDETSKPIDLKIVDLGNWKFGSPGLDMAQVLYTNADQKMRDEHWDDLISEYYTALKCTFPSTKVPSKETILEELKSTAILGYFVASSLLPYLILQDNGDVMPEYSTLSTSTVESHSTMGGERTTIAITDVLLDIINRDFL